MLYITECYLRLSGINVLLIPLEWSSTPKYGVEYSPLIGEGCDINIADTVLVAARAKFRKSRQRRLDETETLSHVLGTGFKRNQNPLNDLANILAREGTSDFEICCTRDGDGCPEGTIRLTMEGSILDSSIGDGWSVLGWSHLALVINDLPYKKWQEVVDDGGPTFRVIFVDEEEGQESSAKARWMTRSLDHVDLRNYDEVIATNVAVISAEIKVYRGRKIPDIRKIYNLCRSKGIKVSFKREEY